MKKVLLSLVGIMTLMSWDANAISLRFKFKVFSSGPIIYACNAGIMPQPTDRRVCYFQGTNQTCTPTDCSTTGQICHSSCVCSSTNGGDWLMNYGKLKYQDFKDHGDNTVTGAGSKTFRATDSNNWSQAFTDADAFNHRITDLSYELGSELYTAKYFVDICYRGSQIEYFEDNIKANWAALAQVNATDFIAQGVNGGENNRDGLVMGPNGNLSYTQLSGVKVQAFMTCDLQGVGNYIYARNNNGQYNTADNEAGFIYGAGLLPVNATEGAGSFISSPQTGVTTSQQDLFNTMFINNSTHAPRFCKVRYVFTETDYNNALPNLRRWTRHGAEMCTYTDITEVDTQGGTSYLR